MKKILILVGIISLFLSTYFFYQSYDKFNNYRNSETFSIINENVYVGGDAYNYIINSNYFTGFNILGVGSVLLSLICFGFAHISSQQQKQIDILSKLTLNNFNQNNDITKIGNQNLTKTTEKKVTLESDN